ncbi:MAG: 3-phosphoglycerate dehydrogenase [Coriobacteriales bacterium]|nr:3-phosphoglycerate dehydrogenase [Coriobacteriales bacterium]
MRHITTIDHITKKGFTDFGEGYEYVDSLDKAEALIIRSTSMHNMEMPPNIEAIARAGAGFNSIPVERYAKQGIVVFNTPGANSNAVKELMVCLFLLASRDVLGSIKWCRDNEDNPNAYVDAEAAKKAFVGQEIKGKTVGVIGLGNVGSKVANALVDLGMKVYGYDPYIAVKDAWQLSRDVVRVNDLDELCSKCEYVTVHVPSEPETWGLIGKEQIACMPDGVILFNYSRETLVDEDAVLEGLESGKISKFFTDFATPKVLKMPRTVVTPHTGAGTAEAEENCANMALDELKDYLENGNITNSVNYPTVNLGICRAAGRIGALHADIPNMIGQITSALSAQGVNIVRMANESYNGNAYTLFDINEPVRPEIVEALRNIEGMWRVRVIK